VPIASQDELDHELVVCDQIGAPIGATTWKLGTVTSGSDGKADSLGSRRRSRSTSPVSLRDSHRRARQDKLRASGILVREKTHWKLVALALSRQLPDTKLFKGATRSPAAATPSLDGTTAATAATAWFTKGGLARAKASTAVASGTAPGEYATGAAVTPLVAAWDKIGLRPDSIEATAFADGAIALIRAVVPLPVKNKTAPMTLYAIAIRDGKAWRWVSLQFTSELATAPHAESPDTTAWSARTASAEPLPQSRCAEAAHERDQPSSTSGFPATSSRLPASRALAERWGAVDDRLADSLVGLGLLHARVAKFGGFTGSLPTATPSRGQSHRGTSRSGS